MESSTRKHCRPGTLETVLQNRRSHHREKPVYSKQKVALAHPN